MAAADGMTRSADGGAADVVAPCDIIQSRHCHVQQCPAATLPCAAVQVAALFNARGNLQKTLQRSSGDDDGSGSSLVQECGRMVQLKVSYGTLLGLIRPNPIVLVSRARSRVYRTGLSRPPSPPATAPPAVADVIPPPPAPAVADVIPSPPAPAVATYTGLVTQRGGDHAQHQLDVDAWMQVTGVDHGRVYCIGTTAHARTLLQPDGAGSSAFTSSTAGPSTSHAGQDRFAALEASHAELQSSHAALEASHAALEASHARLISEVAAMREYMTHIASSMPGAPAPPPPPSFDATPADALPTQPLSSPHPSSPHDALHD
ncbi:hypothetical protein Cni_G06069 [Canna indica]|uniref:Uncharacterized protein n=1 Tax=Canna indica TaxID=4628 RepID=A0AAQ3JZ49_9LILI|nr:hypothetical protein Cni_G06069 [Canna indica]